MEQQRDPFDHKASCIVEEHIRIHGQMVPHPDLIKSAVAEELRRTWNDAIDAALSLTAGIKLKITR